MYHYAAYVSTLCECIKEKGITVVPLSLYFKGSLVKISIGICKGKKLHDKRHTLKEKDSKRDLSRKMKEFNN